MAFDHAAVAKMQPDGFGFRDQIADSQHQSIVDHDAIAGALGTQRVGAEGVSGDDRMQAYHRGKHAIEIEAVVARAGLVRRRHFPFSQRGHGESPGQSARWRSCKSWRMAGHEARDDLMSQTRVLKVSRHVIGLVKYRKVSSE